MKKCPAREEYNGKGSIADTTWIMFCIQKVKFYDSFMILDCIVYFDL